MSTVCCAARRGPGAPMGGSWARVLARHFHWCDGLHGARSMDGRTTCQGHGSPFHLASGKESRVRREGRLSGHPAGPRLIIAAVRRRSEQEAFSE